MSSDDPRRGLPSSPHSAPQLLKQLTSPPVVQSPVTTSSTLAALVAGTKAPYTPTTGSTSPGLSAAATALPRPPMPVRTSPAGSPVRKRLKLDIDAATSSVNSTSADSSLSRRKVLCEKRSKRLKVVTSAYRDSMAELFYLQSGGNVADFPAFRKKPTRQFLNFLKSNNAPGRVTSDVEQLIPGPAISSNPSSPLASTASPSSRLPVAPNLEQRIPQLPIRRPPTTSSGSATPYSPKPSYLSPVKYGENLQPYRSSSTTGGPSTSSSIGHSSGSRPMKLTSYTREQLNEKIKQEAWVLKRVQELTREGMWPMKRLPKVVERSRPKCQWDCLLSEMQWLAVDVHQERQWKKSAAKMLAYSAKDYVAQMQIRRQKQCAEAEVRGRKIASFMAQEIRAFWKNIYHLAEFKLKRQTEVLNTRLLTQQVNYITEHSDVKTNLVKSPMFGEKEIGGTSTVAPILDVSSVENGLPDPSEDDESSILEQETFETQFPPAVEIASLSKDNLQPLKKLLTENYPGVLSEYIDLYDDLVEDQLNSEEEEESELSEEEEEDNVELELSIDSLFADKGRSSQQQQQRVNGNRRDIAELAEEANSLKPKQSLDECSSNDFPLLKGGELRPYQRIGVDWMRSMHERRLNMAIADESGLGRKVQVIAFFSWLCSLPKKSMQQHLIVAPVSAVHEWSAMFERWCPAIHVQQYGGPDRVRKTLRRTWHSHPFQVVLTSYRVFFQDQDYFLSHRWGCLILGEAQNLAKLKPDAMCSLFEMKCSQRLAIISHALPSNPIDLWNLLYIIHPKTYNLSMEYNQNQTLIEGTAEYQDTVKRLLRILSPFILHRTRTQVEAQLPTTEEHVINLMMRGKQKRLYDDHLAKPETQQAIEKGDASSICRVLNELRKICDHPSLIDSDSPTSSQLSTDLFKVESTYPRLVTTATDFDPYRHFNLDSLNFVFLTHETRLTAITSDRIRKFRASKQLIEELPDRPNQPTPSVPPARLILEIQPTTAGRCGMSVSYSSQVVPRDRVSANGSKTSSPSADDRAFHNESINVIAQFNERRCNGLPLYGQDLVQALTITNSVRPLRSRFHGMGYVNCLNATPRFDWVKSEFKKQRRGDHLFKTKTLNNLVQTVALTAEIHSVFQQSLTCYNPTMLLTPHQSEVHIRNEISYLLSSVLPPPSLRLCYKSTLRQMSVKLNKLDEILRAIKARGEKAVVFSDIPEMLHLIQTFMDYHYFLYVYIDSTHSLDEKICRLKPFVNQPEVLCILTSSTTNDLGICNLPRTAKHVIMYDSHWNTSLPSSTSNAWCQRLARANDIQVYRLVCCGSVEENIAKKNLQKRLLVDLKLVNRDNGSVLSKIKKHNLDELFTLHMAGDNGIRTEIIDKDQQRRKEKKLKELGDAEDRAALAKLDFLWSASNDPTGDPVPVSEWQTTESIVDLAELDAGCLMADDVDRGGLEIEMNRMLDNLKPIERYGFLQCRLMRENWDDIHVDYDEPASFTKITKKSWESQYQEELAQIEAEIAHLEVELPVLTYSSTDAGRAWLSHTGQALPMWMPPIPSAILDEREYGAMIEPHLGFLYRQDIMEESELPPVYVKKEASNKRSLDSSHLHDAMGDSKPKYRKEDQGYAPRSLFDRPTPAMIKARRDMKLNRHQGSSSGSRQMLNAPNPVVGLRHPLPRLQVEAENSPEWLIQEDWALLHAVKDLLELPLSLTVMQPAHTANWDMISDMVNAVSRTYRGPRQCRNRYESIIVPREEGRLLYDVTPVSKKHKKLKGSLNKVQHQNRPMKTSQLYQNDNNSTWSQMFASRFESIKAVANKRAPTTKPLVVSANQKNPKHAAVLAESGISYETPLNPILVAQNRAERIQREKQRSQQAAQQELAQQRTAAAQQAAVAAQQTAAATAQQRIAATIAAAAAAPAIATVTTSTPQAQQQQQQQQQIQQTVVQQTPSPQPAVATAAVPAPQAVVVGISQAISTSIASVVNTLQGGRVQQIPQLQTSQANVSNMLRAMTASTSAVVVTSAPVVSVASLTPQSLQAARALVGQTGITQSKFVTTQGRPLTPQELQMLRQKAADAVSQKNVRLQAAGQPLQGGQKQVSVAVTPSGTLTTVAGGSGVGAVTVVTQGGVGGQPKFIRQISAAGKGVRTMNDAEINQFFVAAGAKQQQAALQQKTGQVQVQQGTTLTAAQLLAGIKVQQAGSSATLVQANPNNSGQTQSVTIPIQPGMSLPQIRAAVQSKAGRLPNPAQMQLIQRQIQFQQKAATATSTGGQQKVALSQVAGRKGMPAQLIVQSAPGLQKQLAGAQQVTVQQIQQIVQQVSKPNVQQLVSAGGTQQIIPVIKQTSTGATAGGQQKVQARVIPVSSSAAGRQQTIQVLASPQVAGQTIQRQPAPNVTIDATGRPTGSPALASALGSIKVSSNNSQILTAAGSAYPQPVSVSVVRTNSVTGTQSTAKLQMVTTTATTPQPQQQQSNPPS